MRIIRILWVIMAMGAAFSAHDLMAADMPDADKPIRWTVVYHEGTELSDYDPYDMVILDSHTDVPVHALVNKNKMVLGYVPLGEVGNYRPYFQELKEKGLLLIENPFWKGSYMVDVRNPEWSKYVIEELVPDLLHRGFNGLFLDTIDNAAELERRDPEKFAGMKEAVIILIHMLRTHYPDLVIMQNRGYEVLNGTSPALSMLMAESFIADYHFEDKTYVKVSDELIAWQEERLKQAKVLNPALTIVTLDYWYPDDKEEIKKIYARQRQAGYHPYVSTLALDRIIEEPR